MNFNELSDFIFKSLSQKIRKHKGLSVFASRKAKFEGWLKVELIESLKSFSDDIVPEKYLVDVSFQDWGIELKTINTNYRSDDTIITQRPITKNIESVIKDIEELRKSNKFKNKAVCFIVFPLNESNKIRWEKHIKRIYDKLDKLKFTEFKFNNGVPGILYFGLVKNS